MAVKLITTIQRFQGLSTDTKPSDPPEGSTFHAIDTGEHYIYHDSMWELDLTYSWAMQAALGL